jgi:hypothetical protein
MGSREETIDPRDPSVQDWDKREKERKRKAKGKNGVEDRRDKEC